MRHHSRREYRKQMKLGGKEDEKVEEDSEESKHEGRGSGWFLCRLCSSGTFLDTARNTALPRLLP